MLILKNAFNSFDQKTRKNWFIASLVQWALLPLSYLILALVLVSKGIISEDALTENSSQLVAFIAILAIVFYCAYLKHGNRYLRYMLILSPLGVLRSIGESLKDISGIWDALSIVLGIAVYIWWYITSLKLRAVNKKVVSLKREDRNYLQSISCLRKSENMTNLNKNFSTINKNWPKYKQTTLQEYKLKKKTWKARSS